MRIVRAALAACAALAIGTLAAAAQAQTAPLALGTASTGGTYFVYGEVVAKLLAEKAGLAIAPQQTHGPNQNLILIEDKRLDLGMTTMGVALQAWNGAEDWTRGQKFRAARALFPMYDSRSISSPRNARASGRSPPTKAGPSASDRGSGPPAPIFR